MIQYILKPNTNVLIKLITVFARIGATSQTRIPNYIKEKRKGRQTVNK